MAENHPEEPASLIKTPKGGNLSLADADVKAAVDYLVGLVK